MKAKVLAIFMATGVAVSSFTTTALSQPDKNYYLSITPFDSPKDSLALAIELRFWQELREQVEKSETVKIVANWNQIVKLLKYAEKTQRVRAIFDTSTIRKPQMKAANAEVQGTIRRLRSQEIELDIQIIKIRTGEQIATEQARIPISTDPFKDASTPAIRRLILKLMEPLDPKIKKQKAWLGEPFDPEKINILVTDFTNTKGEVDQRSEDITSATFNKLDKFMKDDPTLSEVAEVKRLSSKGSGFVIREETHAKEIGGALNADMVIWGQNLCIGDSICVFAKAFINHEARTAAIAEEGVLHQYQLLRADLPMLIGARANVLVKFVIGWTYLNDNRHQQFQNALRYLQQALTETSPKERLSILIWAGNAAFHAGQYESALSWYTELERERIKSGDRAGLATTYNNIGSIYNKKGEWDKALEYYGKAEKIRLEVGDRAGLAATYNNIGLIYSKKGEWDKALEYYGKSEKIGLEVGDRAGLATTYNNIGSIYSKKGERDKALEYYGKSEKIRLEVGDRAGLAPTYHNIASIHRQKGDFNQALSFGQKALQIVLQLRDPFGEKNVRSGLSQILTATREYQQAVAHLERCVEIDQQLNHPDLESDRQELLIMQLRAYSASGARYELLDNFLASRNNLQKGRLFQQINDWPRATTHYQSYLRKSQDSLSLADQAQIQNLIGSGYIKQSKGDSALPYLQAALQTYQKLNDQEMVGTVYNNLGSAHKVRQAWPEALAWLRKSAAHNRAVGGDSASVLGFTYSHLAEVFLHTQQPDSARYYVEKSLLLRQALGEAENVKQTRKLREKVLSTPPRSGKK